MIKTSILLIILAAALVTWVPRVLPFVLTQNKSLPPKLVKFLSFLPITIIFALTLSSIMDEKVGSLPSLLPVESLALIPTFLVVLRTKNILLAVVVGVLTTAALRLIF
ncbi:MULTISPECIES: AzlD domain-containing protein [Streptococcus]|uniref:AzlD domain-containing protein n=1 Tax=Streptococcus suivaginalis TaxID=3028082 RepID=A0AA96VS87_9STRE|nr:MULTISPECIES: AzlD domain-containing protein [Streptococcus]MCK4028596.1 AzlD domain-containing protein [Streptococcus suis]MDW8778684.1 AzlD domain-containing protein [Streptococcus suis]NQK55054.1 AzlD domain-containing protein [Streptococcus suis]WNY47280.1 AzlD domain-containing protein [Streptococcus sp. 29896]HEM2815956.1 AzlD domain-containing protein [Streptococcus suis]